MKESGIIKLNKSGLVTALDIGNLLLFLYAAQHAIGNLLYGAALFCAGYAWVVRLRISGYHRAAAQRRLSRVIDIASVVVALLAGLFLFVIYPFLRPHQGHIPLSLALLLLCVRSRIADRFLAYSRSGLGAFLMPQLPLTGLFAWLVFYQYDTTQALVLLGGFLAYTALMSVYIQIRGRRDVVSLSYGEIRSLWSVNTIAMHNNTVFLVYAAFFISVLMYVSLILSPVGVFNERVVLAPFWVLTLGICAAVLGRLFSRRARNMRGVTTIIVAGVIWAVATLTLEGLLLKGTTLRLFGWGIIQMGGMILLWVALMCMQEDFSYLTELEGGITTESIRASRFVMQYNAQYFSFLLAACAFGAMGLHELLENGVFPIDLQQRLISLATYLPMILLLLGMLATLRQPMSPDMLRKLRIYASQKREDKVNASFETKLRSMLVSEYRRRFGVRIIIFLFKPLFYHRVVGADNVDLSEGPVVFVCNHKEIYGPVVANLYIPFTFRPWIHAHMLDKQEVINHIWEGTFSRLKWPRWLAMGLLKAIAPLLLWVLWSLDPIPVYRGNMRSVLKTIDATVDAMEQEDSILIFPENPGTTDDGRYAQEGVSAMYTGFVHIAKQFYQRTGKATTFYPIYADGKTRTITFASGVKYDPQTPAKAEKERIALAMTEAMNAIAGTYAANDQSASQ